MKYRSYYELLGVARTADAEAIKAAYRQQARKYHPDQNPNDPTAEERFKAISEAYRVLSDANARKTYDRFGQAPPGSAFGPRPSVVLKREPPIVNLMKQFAETARRRMQARRGDDLNLRVKIPFVDAIRGTKRVFEVPRASDDDGLKIIRRRLEYPIPPGVVDGQVLRWREEGGPGRYGGGDGDLLVSVEVTPHPVLRRRGFDVWAGLPLTLMECIRGGPIRVPTVNGPQSLDIEPGARPGDILRIEGAGVPRKNGKRGDAVFEVSICLPEGLSPEQVEHLEDFEASLRPEQVSERAALNAALEEDA